MLTSLQHGIAGAHWPAIGGAAASLGPSGVAAALQSRAELPPAALRSLEPGNHGWTQHTAPEGYVYYFNSHTGQSMWERPLALDFPMSR